MIPIMTQFTGQQVSITREYQSNIYDGAFFQIIPVFSFSNRSNLFRTTDQKMSKMVSIFFAVNIHATFPEYYGFLEWQIGIIAQFLVSQEAYIKYVGGRWGRALHIFQKIFRSPGGHRPKYFITPPINFSFLFKAYLQQIFRVVLSNIQISNYQRS